MAGEPHIALDLRPFDTPSAAGQARYARDLVRGLAALDPRARFTLVLGTPPTGAGAMPVPAGWGVRIVPVGHGRGRHLANRIRTGLTARMAGVDLMHGLHTFAPWPRPRHHVFTVYDLMMDRFPEYAAVRASRAHRQYRRAVMRADRTIAISHATADDLVTLWALPRERITVVPLAQDAAAWATAPRGETAEPTILSPYNLEPRKNLRGLLEAFAALRSSHPATRLVLFGRAAVTREREAEFEAHLDALALGDAVTRTGIVSDDVLARWYLSAHVLAFPSLWEGFGLPLVEAMHAGLPIVAHASPAAREVLGDAGVLVDAQDPTAFAGALARMMTDPDRRRAIAAAGRTRAATRGVADIARETWQVYAGVLGGRP